jgi:hypothetical protein
MLRTLIFLAASGGVAASAPAQDFRVFTQVTDLSAGAKAKPRLVSTSLTLFHAGKVYDYVEAAEETVIFEPAQSRFVVMSKRHDLATEISQDEIRRYLSLARTEARSLIAEWQRDDAERKNEIAALEFQLVPEFRVSVNEETKTLSLVSPRFRYDVKYAEAPSQEIVQTYLRSADWAAQINSVLNPRALLPEPRLRLNDELRERGVLPVEVELRMAGERPVHLKASHQWTWKLNPLDRTFIDARETQLRDPNRRLIPFPEFQRETLKAEVGRR